MLTPNAVAILSSSSSTDNPSFNPTVQLLHVKNVRSGAGASERYRVVLSDGTRTVQGMLATQLNSLVSAGQVRDNAVVTVREFISNDVSGKKVVILLNIEVVPWEGGRIGDPAEGGGAAPAPTPSAGPMYGRNAQGSGQNAYGNQGGYGAGGGYGKPAAQATNPSPQKSNPYGGGGARGGYAPVQRSSGVAAQSYGASRLGGMGGTEGPITPISSLNMYQSQWTVKARVTGKSDVRTWSNARGEGSLFSFEILDNSGTDLRCTCFKEAVDKFYNLLEVDKVYTLTGGRLKVANMQYNTCKSNFECTFDQNAEIRRVDDDGAIQQNVYDFTRIGDLESIEPNKNVDLLAYARHVSPVGTVISKKSGQELFKCEITLVDDSNAEVRFTVWGDKAKSAETDFANTPMVAVKGARVSDFGGRSVGSISGTNITKNPRHPEAQRLASWWSQGGSSGQNVVSMSKSGPGGGRVVPFHERKTVASIRTEQLGHGEQPDWLTFRATINFIKKDKEGGPWYTACSKQEDPCNGRPKATQTTDGYWHCDRCNETRPDCLRRYIFSFTVIDDTSTTWASVFDENALVLLGGVTADDLNRKCFSEDYDTDYFENIFANAGFTEWLFKCKVKKEIFGDEERVKTSVYQMTPLNYAEESKNLLTAIQKMNIC